MAKSRLILEKDLIKASNDEQVKAPTKAAKIEKIPKEYIPISLPSNGKLTAPRVLHFRDYTMNDALELNVLDEDDKLLALVSVLNNMCYEDFDCGDFHLDELMALLYTIHATFISNRIEKEYYVDDTLPYGNEEGQLNHPSNIDIVELAINKLNVKSIDEDESGNELTVKFKEPFTLTDSITGSKLKFRMSRVKDLIEAETECNKIFEVELFKYKPLKKQIDALKRIRDVQERKDKLDALIDNNDEYVSYENFIKKYNRAYIMLAQCQQLISIDDIALETLKDKLDAYKTKVPVDIWNEYNKIVEEYKFGINEMQEFFSETRQETLTRRFLFRLDEFLPDINRTNSTRYSVSFD